jgi:hypothetical protein
MTHGQTGLARPDHDDRQTARHCDHHASFRCPTNGTLPMVMSAGPRLKYNV